MTGERVIQTGIDGSAFDIGVGPTPQDRRRPKQSNLPSGNGRPLPRWAAVVVAILAGWVLGALMNAQSEAVTQPEPASTPQAVSPAPAAEPAAVESAPPESAPTERFEEGPVEAVYEQFGGLIVDPEPADVAAVVMVQAPLRGVAIPADIQVIENGVATQIELDRSIAGATQGIVGQGDRRMLVVEETVVFMALDSVMAFDPFEKTEPIEVAQAIYLLPGSEPGRAWAVSSGSNTVTDIDVRAQRARTEYDLRSVGAPLASYNGGLVVAPVDRSLGTFALWSPARGIEPLGLKDHVTFIGAGANLVVIHTPEGLGTYNTVTASFTQTSYEIPPSAQRRSIVSPDGSHVAIAAQGSVTELPIVLIVDTATGEQVDVFDAAFAWQLQWVSPDEVLFMLPEVDAVSVMLRNTATRTSSLVTELVGPNYWVTVAG